MGASILRLHFHDCFAQGCDGSVLLDGSSGEKTAGPNSHSVRGFKTLDGIKSQLEAACSGVVSCADILAVAARDSVVQLGGPTWTVTLGRRDSTTSNKIAANANIPAPTSTLNNLTSLFQAQGLSTKDMVALSGAHTIGQARCTVIRNRIYNDTDIDSAYAKSLQSNCPSDKSGNRNLSPLEDVSPNVFDNNYYKELRKIEGIRILQYSFGEKTAGPNSHSVRGFKTLDGIKSHELEAACSGVVSCADILAVVARDSVVQLGGPTSTLNNLTSLFQAQGLSTKDMVALSGAHTIGQARCTVIRNRIYNDTDIDSAYAKSLQSNCPSDKSGNRNLSPLDDVSPNVFDNNYYKELRKMKGLLHSDQELFNGGSTDSLVTTYSTDENTFFNDFAAAMVKMGNISPLTGSNGEIRKNCRKAN